MSASRAFLLSIAAAAALLAGTPASAQALDAEARTRVVVAYRAGSSAIVRAQLARLGAQVVFDLSQAHAVAVSVPRAAVPAIAAMAGVDFVEGEFERRLMGRPSRSVLRPAAAPASETVPYGITMVQADQLPAPGPGFASKKLCIIDSGVDGTHEDLAANDMKGKNYTTSGTWDSDEDSHGTHVTGIAAALGGNGLGVVGVAPNKELPLFVSKVFGASGGASSLTVAAGMLGCLLGRADVVNMSLGGSRPSRIEERVADLLASRNVLVIAAAGNAGDDSVSYPAGFASVMSVAAIDITMAAADFSQFNPDVELAAPGVDVVSTVPAFSQDGASLSVGAVQYQVEEMENSPRTSATGPLADFGIGDTPSPGSMTGKVCLIQRGTIPFAEKVTNCEASGGVGAIIYNNVPDEQVLGTLGDTVTTIPSVGAFQADGVAMLGQLGQSATVAVFALPDLYAAFSGTSMASPHAAAVAALVWSHFPGCTAAQIRGHLNASALDLGAAGRDEHFGYGLVQAKAMHARIAGLGGGC